MTSVEEKKTIALQKASKKIERLKKELAEAKRLQRAEPLAVVGMGCAFPGDAYSVESYWNNLEKGVDAITVVPSNRWDADAFFSANPDAPGKINSKYGGFLTSDIALFDAPFFNISPKEAQAMDPQQRLVLEIAWQALENAAINPQSLKGSLTGIYMGTSFNDYGLLFSRDVADEHLDAYFCSGNGSSLMAGRLAYILGTHGPAMACDTSCASSLVSVHLACKALSSGEIDIAIAGGVNLILSPHSFISFSKAHLLSEDGRCKSFDQHANGYSRGEGCGVIVIKRLYDAYKSNDRILCLIKGSAVNQDGDSNGLTVPNPKAQERVIKQALKTAGIMPEDIDVLEAHGTGTALSDAIEMDAIRQVFSGREHPLHIGSVKTNIGNLESASGIASMIKMILALQHQKIPKHLHFTKPHSQFDLKAFNGCIVTENQAWVPSDNHTRRAGISSFGLNGTNAHVVIEEAPKDIGDAVSSLHGKEGPPVVGYSARPYLFCFSAKSQAALNDQLSLLSAFLEGPMAQELSPGDVSFTLNTGRAQFEYRVAMIANSLEALNAQLKKYASSHEGDSTSLTSSNATLEIQKALEFLDGQRVNFDILYDYPTQKLALPGYVFQKKRHWFLKSRLALDTSGVHKTNPHKQIPAYTLDWHAMEIEQLHPATVENLSRELLVISPAKHGFTRLKREMLPMKVTLAESVPMITSTRHALYVYPEVKASDTDLTKCFFRLHQCVQKLLRMPLIKSIGVIINDSLSHSMVEGYWKTLCIEHPDKQIYLIESSLNQDACHFDSEHSEEEEFPDNQEKLLSSIIKMLSHGSCEENHVAIRNGVIFVPRIVKLNDTQEHNTFKYSTEKTYLITGGLSGLGKELVEHLVRKNAKHLVLLDKVMSDQLPSWFTVLQGTGIDLQYHCVNVSDTEHLQAIIDALCQSTAPLAGIFHLASELTNNTIAKLSPEDFTQTFDSKIGGSLALHNASKALSLDCFVLFSSITATFGSPGQANYVAANRFMDVLCQVRQSAGLPALSINWGLLAAEGMTINHMGKLQAIGLVPIEGVDAFASMDRFLAQPYPQVMIADINWAQVTGLIKNTGLLSLLDQTTVHWKPLLLTTLEKAPLEQRTAILTEELKTMVAEVLGMGDVNDIHEHHDFMALGVDSLMTLTLWSQLQVMVGAKQALPKSLLLECPSIAALRDYFQETIFYDLFEHPVKRSISLGASSEKDIRYPDSEHNAGEGLHGHQEMSCKPQQTMAYTEEQQPSQRLYSQQLSFRQGVNERGEGRYTQYMTEAERVCNTAERLSRATTWNSSAKSISNIFLTGGTGTLGGYLIKLFLEQTNVKLHCLVRGEHASEGLQRIRRILETYDTSHSALSQLESRVNIYCGDMICDRFSLRPEQYSQLLHVTDLCIHSAARISLGESFEDLYESNVLGTKNVIKFALETQNKSLIFISSYSVMGDRYLSASSPFKETDVDLGQGFHNMGYQKTKFEAERAVRAAKSSGLKWRIVRPGNLFGDSETGAYPLNAEAVPSVFYDLLKTVIETKVASLSPLYFDVTPVDYVAKAMMHIIFNQPQSFLTYHLTNPDVKRFPDVIQTLNDMGYAIQLIPTDDYIHRVFTHQLRHAGQVYQSLTTSMVQYKASKVIPEHSTCTDATWTSHLLVDAGIHCPRIDKKLLRTYLTYCASQGYITVSSKEFTYSCVLGNPC